MSALPSPSPAPVRSVARATGYDSLWPLRRIQSEPIAFLESLAAQGDLVPFSLGRRSAIFLNDPAIIERVLVTGARNYVKPPALRRATRLLGQGLLTAEPPLHTERRRVIQPAFHHRQISRYAEIVVRRSRAMVDAWSDGGVADVGEAMRRLALGVAGEALFGADLEPHSAELRRIVSGALAALDPLVALVAPRRRLQPERDRLLAIVDDLIDRRLGGQIGEDLLDLLLAVQGDAPDRDQLQDDVLTMLLAAHDTVSIAMTWTWVQLAAQPEAARRLHVEAAGAGARGGLAMEDVAKLPYARAVLAESLRLRPPAWIIARESREADRLGSTAIGAGTLVIMSPFVTHRDARFFADPLEFQPDRWLGEAVSDRPKLAFFPFGAGRRACIGESFAWMEGVLVLATVAASWQLRLTEAPPALDPRITLRPLGPVPMATLSQ
jgi:cytochrome P450